MTWRGRLREATGSAGDFATVVRQHEDAVYGVALRILGDRDLSREVANSTFVKAYRGWHRYDAARPLRAWLLAIAANEAISAGRVRTREWARALPVDDALGLHDPAPTPGEAAVAREERERIRRAVAALPELYRAPVVLRYFGDLSPAEIGAALGRSASTVGVQLLRARALLRDSLAEGEIT